MANSTQISIEKQGPATLTILPTYRCTAACEQCCFGSNPDIRERLTLEEIVDSIKTAHRNFSSLRHVVFSGGECVMIGDDLFESIRVATELGLGTRIVSNGYWGASKNKSAITAKRLRESGLKEINISTGRDHAKFVSIDAVLNAMTDAVSQGIFGFLTVEKDAEDSAVFNEITADPRFAALNALGESRFRYQINTWMKFNEQHKDRGTSASTKPNSPCSQLFSNLVVTPHKNISACCGLTHEHIPEMRIGSLDTNGLAAAYEAQTKDFMKIWIHVDGPDGIIKKVYGGNPPPELISNDHMCDTCARLHKCDQTRSLVRERYQEFYPDVMFRYEMKNLLDRISQPN
ncbi:radical SAM protein [Duganella sp. FT92W]|uniref:Radical SAM protein n=1 Tax=Pseudoduganella rivuli TaxID=2666085 RepID=A0A7X2LV05_9BURK|nr:radical SAM protein [Pseudoduganella rivuli]MRV74971.1 radical SAM protein [Pseudoduganella rivuli]